MEGRAIEGVAKTAWDAARYAALQDTYAAGGDDRARVECDEGVGLEHAESGRDGFAYWSDGRVTTADGLVCDGSEPGLEVAAARLIAEVRGARRNEPTCGWAALARVAEVGERETFDVGRRRHGGLRDRRERLVVTAVDGEERFLWMSSGAEREDLRCDVYGDPPKTWYEED